MKTTILLSVLMITMTSFELRHSEIDSKQKLGLQMIDALRHPTSDAFSSAIPTLEEFHRLMDRNQSLYGENLQVAKSAFEQQYHGSLLPAIRRSFKDLISQGKKAGIDWNTIRLVSVDIEEDPTADFDVLPLTIVFTSKKKQYRINIDRALVIEGRWRISQFIKLE